MIGPWKVVINGFENEFRAMTCIGSVTNLPEVIPVENKKSRIVVEAFEDGWMIRYHVPMRCVHDNVNEILGLEFT